MERRHQKVAGAARAVSRAHAARAICAVCGRRQSDDEDPGEWIAEARNGPPPVRVGQIRAPFFACDTLTVRSQTRAAVARDDVRVDRSQFCHWCMIPMTLCSGSPRSQLVEERGE